MAVDLAAPDYSGGTLDWFHFDATRTVAITGEAVPGLTHKRLTALPTSVQFAGMPAARWWEFEDADADADLSSLPSEPDDLGRSVLATFATVAGDDWHSVPCDLPSGAIATVDDLQVLDDFGQLTPIRAAAVNDSVLGDQVCGAGSS